MKTIKGAGGREGPPRTRGQGGDTSARNRTVGRAVRSWGAWGGRGGGAAFRASNPSMGDGLQS